MSTVHRSRRLWLRLGVLFAISLPFAASACGNDCPDGYDDVDGECVYQIPE